MAQRFPHRLRRHDPVLGHGAQLPSAVGPQSDCRLREPPLHGSHAGVPGREL